MVGRRRVAISAVRELDGYRVADATLLHDAPPGAEQGGDDAAGPRDAGSGRGRASSLAESAAAVLGVCDQLLERLRAVLAARRMGAGQVRELMDR